MTSLCTLITVIVGLAIAIPACNAHYLATPKNLLALRQEAIIKIEKMQKHINEIFEEGHLKGDELVKQLQQNILDFQDRKLEYLRGQDNSIRDNIEKSIQYAKGVALGSCTDQWVDKLKTLKENAISRLQNCTSDLVTEAVAFANSITKDKGDNLNYLNGKKYGVEECEKIYKNDKSVLTEYQLAEYCIIEAETIPEDFLRNAYRSIIKNHAGVFRIIEKLDGSAGACFRAGSFDEFLKETASLLTSTRKCIHERKISFLKEHPDFMIACVEEKFVKLPNEDKGKWGCADWTLDVPSPGFTGKFPYKIDRASAWRDSM